MKCEICGNEKDVANVTIDDKEMQICADCMSKIGEVHSFGYTVKIGNKPVPDGEQKVTNVYFKTTHPEYFANADTIKLSYGYTGDGDGDTDLTQEKWEFKGKLDLIAPLMGIERDGSMNYLKLIIEYLSNETSKFHEEAWKYYDSLIPISEEEYEAGIRKDSGEDK